MDNLSPASRISSLLGCDEVRQHLPAFALGALDAADAEGISEHLLTCRACRQELDRYADIVDFIGFTAPPATPAPQLRDLVLGALEPAPRKVLTVSWRWMAAAAAVIVMLLAGNVTLLLTRPAGGKPAPAATNRVASGPTPEMDWFDLAATNPEAKSAYGILCAQKTGNLAWLIAEDLPPLPPGKVYQAWLTIGDQRVSAGTFMVDSLGRGFLTIRLTRPIQSYSVLGVTEEPFGGSPNPSGDRYLNVSL